MTTEIAMSCATAAFVAAAVVAVYWTRVALRLRARVAGLEEACAVRDAAMEQLVAVGLPTAADPMADPGPAAAAFTPARSLVGTAFAENAGVLAQRYTGGVHRLQAEAAEAAERRGEEKAHQTTESAVRSFAEAVVGLGANLSKVVGQAMRQHRGHEMFETLTLIDHTVQQMVRQAQSYVVVCGGLPGRRWPAQSMTDVVRGAMGRIQDYQRIRPRELPRQVIGQAVEPAVHALAMLLDNAARYSPPGSFVDVTFQDGHHGVTVIIDDAGVRMSSEQLDSARRTLSGQDPVDLHRFGPHPKIGFPTVAALSRRYGFQVSVDGSSPFGGTRAALFIPERLLADAAAPAPPTTPKTVPQTQPESGPDPEADAGLPRRRRQAASADAERTAPALSASPPRPSLAAAWQSNAHRNESAGAKTDSAEGTL
jgi:hypothetical protein